MKRNVLLAGAAGEAGSAEIQLDGSEFHYTREDGAAAGGGFSIEPLEPGCYSVLIGGVSYRVARGANGEWLVNGEPVAVEIADPRRRRSRRTGAADHGPSEIAAPMPGKVVRILVTVGDAVEAGQGLVVVEAMKMQNEMKSPKAGRVTEIRTRPDQAVAAGEILVIVE